MHIYAFGSICRGEIDFGSDVDLLAIVDKPEHKLDRQKFSIYSYNRITELWDSGNPFAWHLCIESRLLYGEDGGDFLRELGTPARYTNAVADCEKFSEVFSSALGSLKRSRSSDVFDLSSMFLGIRNLATCYLLGAQGEFVFSRHAALRVDRTPLPLSPSAYNILENARILSTRGIGEVPTNEQIDEVLIESPTVETWMGRLTTLAREHDRIRESN